MAEKFDGLGLYFSELKDDLLCIPPRFDPGLVSGLTASLGLRSGGFFFENYPRTSAMDTGEQTLRTVFLVDGFNLYHSLESALKLMPGVPLKWLDLPRLLTETLPLVGPLARFAAVHYFSAYAYHLHATRPDKIARHKAYVRALTASGVREHIGKFQTRDVWCHSCRGYINAHEEKETDVALACLLLELAARDALDVAVVVSGDSDLAPAVRTFQALYPGKRVLFAFPFDRMNNELGRLAPGSFTLSKETYAKHQFPEQVRLPSGKFVTKPSEW